jgi:hypothetical protein
MKKLFWISYDLDKPGQNYLQLIARLRQLGAIEHMRSDWLLVSTAGSEAIRNDLQRYLDSNDRILVAALSGDAAWDNLLVSNQQVQQAFAA